MAEQLSSEVVNLYQPKKRFLIPINNFHVPKKLFKLFKKNNYIFRINNSFEKVISQCQIVNRKDNGTLINDIILNTYINLYRYKFCHSVECYDENKLVGGLYGVHIGSCFFGESMFSNVSNASKFCLLYLIAILKKNLFFICDGCSDFSLIDSVYETKNPMGFKIYLFKNKEKIKITSLIEFPSFSSFSF